MRTRMVVGQRSRMVVGGLTVVGDVLCPGVDVDEWMSKNKVPLFSQRQNVWVLARSNDDGLTKNEITESLYQAFAYWFGSVDSVAAFEDRARFGDADSLKVVSITEALPSIGKIAKRKETLPSPPTISGNKIVYAKVSFDYRGSADSMAWPCFTSIWGGKIQGTCPNSCDWALQATEEPTKAVEPERSDGDVLGDLGDKMTDFGGDVVDAVKTPFYVLSAVVGILGVAYILGKVKK